MPAESATARLDRFQRVIGRAEEGLAIVLVAAMAGVVNLQIVARYVFGAPFIWCEEVSRLILVWLTFVAAAALLRRGGDIAVDTFVDMLAPAWHRAVLAARDVLMMAVFGLVAWEGFRLAGAVAGMPLVATEWPTALLAWPLVIGCSLIVLHVLLRLLRSLSGAPPARHFADGSS